MVRVRVADLGDPVPLKGAPEPGEREKDVPDLDPLRLDLPGVDEAARERGSGNGCE